MSTVMFYIRLAYHALYRSNRSREWLNKVQLDFLCFKCIHFVTQALLACSVPSCNTDLKQTEQRTIQQMCRVGPTVFIQKWKPCKMELVESLLLSKEDERNPRGGCHVKCATLQLNRRVSYNTTGALSGHTWQLVC